MGKDGAEDGPQREVALIIGAVVAYVIADQLVSNHLVSNDCGIDKSVGILDSNRKQRNRGVISAINSMLCFVGNKGWVRIGLLLVLRVLWQIIPGLSTCAIFWAWATIGYISIIKKANIGSKVGFTIATAGAMMNGVVTLANGGFMPVSSDQSFSLWVTATNQHNLLWLSDKFAGFSIGDIVIGIGILSAIFLGVVVKLRERL